MKTNATIDQLNKALESINKEYDNNISFNRIENKTKNRVIFTLKAKSKLNGARKSASGRNLPKASWHVHGKLFDELFNINPSIFIDSMGKKITIDNGNWQDMNVGSAMNPKQMSELSIEEL